MQLDSVYQLKALCKGFYEKKEKLSADLVQTLDALNNERPKVLGIKKRCLNIEAMKTSNVLDDMGWMRINAERERIAQFRSIAEESATLYYKILTKFTEET